MSKLWVTLIILCNLIIGITTAGTVAAFGLEPQIVDMLVLASSAVAERTSLLFLEFPPGETRLPVIHANTLSGPRTQLQNEPAS